MAIEFRGGGAFYYRKRREGDRVVSEYVGGGLTGLIVAKDDEKARAKRTEAEAAWRAERARMEEEERAAVAYCDRVEAQVREMLTAMGYHRPKRHQWRKRRVRIEPVPAGRDGRGSQETGTRGAGDLRAGPEGGRERPGGLPGDAG